MVYLTDTLVIITSYLVGSISFSVIVSKIYDLPDPQTAHSGNPGATNVMRSGGRWAGFLTFSGDFLKGFLPVIVAERTGFPTITVAAVAMAAFLGHLFPLYHRFCGGKGVATFGGCLCAMNGIAGAIWATLWLVLFILFRYAAVASMFACILTPFALWWMVQSPFLTGVIAVMSVLIVLRHHDNIRRLLDGVESRF